MHLVCTLHGLREWFLRRPEFELNLQLPRKWENESESLNNNVGRDHMLWCQMRAAETGRLRPNASIRAQPSHADSIQTALVCRRFWSRPSIWIRDHRSGMTNGKTLSFCIYVIFRGEIWTTIIHHWEKLIHTIAW